VYDPGESYFGGRRKGKRGRGAAGKVAVFGILRRGGRVYTVVPLDSVVHTNGFSAYGSLDMAALERHRIDHGEMLVSERSAHINSIENFWSQAKRTLRRYNGAKAHFERFLKECEWRFNHGPPQELRQTLLNWHLT